MSLSSRTAALLTSALATSMLAAQCDLHWLGGELPGADSWVVAVAAWDPDGPGPAASRLVAGGIFHAVGDVPCGLVAAMDPASSRWSALGPPLVGDSVNALLALPNGDLVAGGRFTCPGVAGTYNIARWDGASWNALGGGVGGRVDDLALAPNGDVIVVGAFQIAGGVSAVGVARWDGSAWSALGTGVTGALAVEVLQNGDVIVAGAFPAAGGVPAANVARWDGTAWSALGAGIGAGSTTITPVVNDLGVLPNGDLVAGGNFYAAGGASAQHAARWDGQAWHAMGSPWQRIFALHVLRNGDVAICLETMTGVQIWSAASSSWYGIGASLDGRANAITELDHGEVCVGGSFREFAGNAAYNLARYDGTAWSALAPGHPPDGAISGLLATPSGDIVARGGFAEIGGVPAQGMARWNGQGWSTLGSQQLFALGTSAWTALGNGDLVITGFLPPGLLRWNGSTWGLIAQLPGGTASSRVDALLELPNGDLLAGGSFNLQGAAPANLARWDGSSWTLFGGGANGPVSRLVQLRSGDLVAAGTFSSIGGTPAPGLARWNGASWSAIGNEVATWSAVVELDDGDLAACGTVPYGVAVPFTRGVARWDGQVWHTLGQGLYPPPSGLVALPGGDLIATGSLLLLQGPVECRGIARWDGIAWQTVGMGFGGGVRAVVAGRSGELFFGGDFTTAGGIGAVNFARLAPDCPASAHPYGTWCASSVGPMQFMANDLPWVGSTYRATCTGIAGNGLAFGVFGLGQSLVSLSQWYGGSLPGCWLYVSHMGSEWLPATQGRATLSLSVPAAPSLVGAVVRHQVLQAEPGLGGQAFRLSSSNGLLATIGSF